ncbi:MAG: hypothetical protein GY730_07770 [bacterium]|nr:hypothetical protein [bacterium]
MANCHNLFEDFYKKIKLSETQKENLKRSRDTLRKQIRNYLKDDNENEPKFHGQGSYMMHTINSPINDKFDLDDGIYFSGNENKRMGVDHYHSLIVNAVKGHAANVSDKPTCIRVEYSNNYNIDLPIYYFSNESSHPELAHSCNGWILSDPREFYEWFNEATSKKPQLRRIVRFIKAWKDNIKQDSERKFPSGLILTILVKKNFIGDKQDDVSFGKTLLEILECLNADFSCHRPTTPKDENLLEDFNDDKEYFMNSLKEICESASRALAHPIQAEACLEWKKHLGNRFSCANACRSIEGSKKYSTPTQIKINANSALENV